MTEKSTREPPTTRDISTGSLDILRFLRNFANAFFLQRNFEFMNNKAYILLAEGFEVIEYEE